MKTNQKHKTWEQWKLERKRQIDLPGTSQYKDQYSFEFPGPSFCFLYPRNEVEEVGNEEAPKGRDKTSR